MHILLFILIFIIAIFVFGLSIIGFILRTIFGLGRGSSHARNKRNRDVQANRTIAKEIAVQMMMKRKYIPRMFRRKDIKKYSPRTMVNM